MSPIRTCLRSSESNIGKKQNHVRKIACIFCILKKVGRFWSHHAWINMVPFRLIRFRVNFWFCWVIVFFIQRLHISGLSTSHLHSLNRIPFYQTLVNIERALLDAIVVGTSKGIGKTIIIWTFLFIHFRSLQMRHELIDVWYTMHELINHFSENWVQIQSQLRR